MDEPEAKPEIARRQSGNLRPEVVGRSAFASLQRSLLPAPRSLLHAPRFLLPAYGVTQMVPKTGGISRTAVRRL
jgi:hypothetical protein